MKEFVLLYPTRQTIRRDIQAGADREKHANHTSRLAHIQELKVVYRKQFNACIDERYRANGFRVTYTVFSESSVSSLIDVRPEDQVLEVEVDERTHHEQQVYPDPQRLLDELQNVHELRVGGYHLTDCVDSFARAAHNRGIDTLVDEDLTELFLRRVDDPSFRTDTYPSYDVKKRVGDAFEAMMLARKDKPWLYQDF